MTLEKWDFRWGLAVMHHSVPTSDTGVLQITLEDTGNSRQRLGKSPTGVCMGVFPGSVFFATVRPHLTLYPVLHFALKTCSKARDKLMEIAIQMSAVL